jgi:dihydroflavonol-4-reductase
MKCLVTGASGFLGINLVRELANRGWQVRAAGFRGDGFKYLNDLPIEIVQADITEQDQVDRIVSGCQVVFHVAADTSFWWRRNRRQAQVNVDGTANVCRACIGNRVQRLVYTSTNDVLGYDPGGGMVDEQSGRFNFDGMGYHYGETKHRAEQELRKLARRSGLDVVYLYPGFMIGPYDHTLQLGRVFFDLINNRLPGFMPGGGSYCHVTEVAKAHAAAAEFAQTGDGYLLAGASHSNVSHQHVWELMAQAAGASPPKRVLPKWALLLYAATCVMTSEITRKPPQIDLGQARYMTKHQYCDSSKAMEKLNYVVPGLETCINDALTWYRGNGFLKASRGVVALHVKRRPFNDE